MTYRTLIIEDEFHSREHLRDMLAEYSEIEIIGEAEDGLHAIQLIDTLKPELIFLDINMPGLTGLEVLQRIQHRPLIVFVTAYDQYALRAFEENAVDYILKPTSKERLSATIARVLAQNRRLDDQMLHGMQLLLGQKKYLQRFAIATGDEIIIIAKEDVFFIKAEDKYVFLHTENRRFIMDTPLKELEELLDPAHFCRIHKSYIVAIDKIAAIKKWFHGELVIHLKDSQKTSLKVSRHHIAQFKQLFHF